MLLSHAKTFEQYVRGTSAVKNGGLFLSAVIETEPKMNKRGNPYYGHVLKIQKIRAAAGFGYEKLVNNRLVRENKDDGFDAQKPKGRHHIAESAIITESDKEPGQYYMNLFMLSDDCKTWETYIDKRTGKEISKNDILPWLSKSSSYGASLQGGLENKVRIIVPKLQNIRELKCGEYEYRG